MDLGRRPLLAAGLAGLSAPARSSEAQVLRFVPHARLVGLDPLTYGSRITRMHGLMVFDTLYGVGSGFTPQPQMAEGHEWLDGFTTLVIRLRDGLRFHNGDRVVARDVLASLRRWMEIDLAGRMLRASISEETALNDRTLRLRFRQPQPLFLDAISKYRPLFIMPADVLEAAGRGPVTTLIGSGPFRFLPEEWVPGDHAAYARFDAYVPRPEPADMLAGGKRAYFDRVEWRFSPDPIVAVSWVHSGAADWWENPFPGVLSLLRGNPALRLEAVELWGFLGALRPNHTQPPFNNPRFRRAVFESLDQAAIMRAVAGLDPANWRAPVGFFTPGTPFASDPATLPPTSPKRTEERRRLIAESGYAGETVVLLHAHDVPVLDVLAVAVAQQLGDAGVKVELRPTPWAHVEEALSQRGSPEARGWGALAFAISGSEALTPLTHSFIRGPASNPVFGWPESADIERHVQRWIQATTYAEQLEEAHNIEAAAFQDLPYLPLGQFTQPHAIRRDIGGVLRAPVPVLWNVQRR